MMRRLKRLPLPLAILCSFALLTNTAYAMVEPDNGADLNVSTSWAEPVFPDGDTAEIADSLMEIFGDTDPAELITGILSAMGGGNEGGGDIGTPLTPAGNMTLVDDYGGDAATKTERQFLTVTSKNGNYFYLVIDRANDGSENVHFLNQVDEADLMALMDTGEEASPPACSCTEKCYVGSVNTGCEICATNMASCVGKEPAPAASTEGDAEPEPEEPQESQEKEGGLSAVSIVLIVALAGAVAVYFLKFRKGKDAAPGLRGGTGGYDYGDDEDGDEDLEDEDE